METAAIYGLGKILGHHCLSLSAIVANRVNMTFSENAEAAVQKLIEHTLSVLAENQ
jgi:uridine phosphorylase